MKLFVTLTPTKDVLDKLRDARRKFAKHKRHLDYVPVDQLHIILKYLGNKVSESSYQAIVDTLKSNEGEYEPVELTLKGLQFGFPKEADPKMLMAKVVKSEQISNLAAVVHGLVRELGFRDVINFKKRYADNFHVTLARTTDRTSRNILKTIVKEAIQYKDEEFGTFKAEEMQIIESEYSFNKGTTYKVLEKIKL